MHSNWMHTTCCRFNGCNQRFPCCACQRGSGFLEKSTFSTDISFERARRHSGYDVGHGKSTQVDILFCHDSIVSCVRRGGTLSCTITALIFFMIFGPLLRILICVIQQDKRGPDFRPWKTQVEKTFFYGMRVSLP